MTPNLSLHIGELELHGLDPAGRFELAMGLESELLLLLREQGVPEGMLTGAELQPLSFEAVPTAAPRELGRALARTLYEGWR